VTVETALAAAHPPVDADRVSLQQVLLNLVVNAMEAMDGTAEGERKLLVGTRESEGAIEIVVSDNGNGLPAGRVDEIFEPFFTTKQEGIGLGLVIARSIVEAHSGRIRAENRAGGGATFCVSFPVRPPV
jgi:C4-dicarboxylate-specific signal transduction histidine kinase